MQAGRKPKSREAKIAAGTYQACRDKPSVLITEKSTPLMPDYLSTDAEAVWFECIHRVMQAGTCELDSNMFARYCTLESLVRGLFKSGELPKAALITELRRLEELLGIGGAPSRANRGTPGSASAAPANPFATLPEA